MALPSPITLADVDAAAARLSPYLAPTPARRYPTLDAVVGHGIRVTVKHENHQPTQSFKVRNGLSAMTALDAAARDRGVVTASTGNHGQAIAYAGHLLGVPATVCVPRGNNPEKNAAIRGWGAELVESGDDYDASVLAAQDLARTRGATLVHSTNDRAVIAGAATMTRELLAQAPDLDTLVVALGGGSQAVGALTVAAAVRPGLAIYAVQAAGAANQHDAWHARRRLPRGAARTFAEGIATGTTYDLTFDTLVAGLAGFVTVTDDDLLDAMRVLWTHTHNLPEGAGAAGLAGLRQLAPSLAGRSVGIVLCGGNERAEILRRVFD